MNRCSACKFHEAQGEGKDGHGNPAPVGFCMRFPPQVSIQGTASFPIVGSETNWCGEFRTAPKNAKPSRSKGSRR